MCDRLMEDIERRPSTQTQQSRRGPMCKGDRLTNSEPFVHEEKVFFAKRTARCMSPLAHAEVLRCPPGSGFQMKASSPRLADWPTRRRSFYS